MHIHFCHLSHAHIHINTHKYAYLWNVHVHKSVHTSPYILEYINEICNVVLFFFSLHCICLFLRVPFICSVTGKQKQNYNERLLLLTIHKKYILPNFLSRVLPFIRNEIMLKYRCISLPWYKGAKTRRFHIPLFQTM